MKNPIPGVVVLPQPVGNTWIWFNMSKPPFDNKKVRQAIAYAVDKQELSMPPSGAWERWLTINLS